MRHPLYLATCSTGSVPNEHYLNMLTGVDFALCVRAPIEIACFNGLLLLGGYDVDPALYGQRHVHPTTTIDAPRDFMELALIQQFAAAGKPIFGICRGIQVLNVALGGTLHQDIPSSTVLNPLAHSDGARHVVTHTPGCFAHALWGACSEVNSYHHQAIDRLAPGLRAVSIADDGLIEAVQHEHLPIYAVQWHPEREPIQPEFFKLLTQIS